MTSRAKLSAAALAGGLLVVAGFAALNYVVFTKLPSPKLTAMQPLAELGSLSAESCAVCHAAIVDEWRASNHAMATRDPLYVADFRAQGEPYFCEYCHAPLVEQRATIITGLWSAWPSMVTRNQTNDRFDSDLRAEGVTCVVCHQVDGQMLGPHTVDAPHAVRVTNELSNPQACAPCHSLDIGPLAQLDRPLMQTVDEWQQYQVAGGDKVCIDCHMPPTEPRVAGKGGPMRVTRSHRLRGPFDPDFVSSAVAFENAAINVKASGVTGKATLRNLTGHYLPTAEPHRRLELRLAWLDATERPLAAVVERIERAIDLERRVEVPGSETALRPAETRSLVLEIAGPAPGGATAARLRLLFYRWDPEHPLAKAVGMDAAQLIQVIAELKVPAA